MSAGRLWASATIDAALPAGTNNIGDVDVLTLPALAAGTNNIGDVDVLSVPAPLSTTGGGTEAAALRVTLASDSTGVVSVDDNGGALTVDGTVAISGTVAVTDNAGSLTVDNGGTFAVQVDGSALTALQLIDNVVLAEDAAHVSGDSGVMTLAVRKDTGAAVAGTDGDYSPLQVDASGNLRVNVAAGGAGDGAILDGVSSSIKASVLDYTNSNPLAVRLSDTNGDYVAAGAGTQYTEDAAAAADPVGSMLMAVRKDTLAGITSADGDNIALRATDKGELYVKQTDAVPITDNAGSLTVDGTVTANLAAGTNNIGDIDVLSVPAPLSTTGGGTEATALRVTVASDSTGVLSVDDNGGALTVDNGGTFAVQATVAAGATNIAKAEDVASADADVGVPAMAVRKATPANTSGTDGDYEMLQMSAGRLWVDPSGVTLTVASHAVTNAGTFAVQDSEKVTDNAGFTDGTTKVLPAGYIFDETAGTALTENDAAAARIDTKRAQVLVLEDESTRGQRATVNSSKGLAVTAIPHTSGGLSVYHVVSAGSTNTANVKASAGQLYGWHITNTNASARYVKLHNTAGTPTAGSSIFMTIGLPASGGSNVSFDQGIAFGTGIGISIVTGVADSDATAVAANDVQVNLFYK